MSRWRRRGPGDDVPRATPSVGTLTSFDVALAPEAAVPMAGDGCLVAIDVTKSFAGLVALDKVDVEVKRGEIVGLIGPNGAGKTTFFNCVTGFTAPTRGRVSFDGRDVTSLSPARRAELGMARTFQHAQLFGHLTVRENLLLGRHLHYGAPAWQAAIGLPRARRAERAADAAVREIAARTGLTPVLDATISDLPYGTQRMIEVARALATEPRMLLLDEPGAGMDTSESAYFGQMLRGIHEERGLAMLLIEHDVALVMAVCDRVYVLDFGVLIASGSPDEIRRNPQVQAAYFGSEVVGA
jgi:branched-chain amino acid transport system ATP-binding protein